ncbi:MAG: glycosyltransferase family 87 protein, partial [Pseudomonadota bacterium]
MKNLGRVVTGLGVLNLVLAALWCAGIALLINRSQAHLDAWPSDFGVFWQVAKLTLAGDGARAFDAEAMAPLWQLPSTASYAWAPLWLYPPTWAAITAPFGALAFSPAYALYSALSLAVFTGALRSAVAGLPGGVMLVIASPTVLAGIMLGNNGLITAAIATAALTALAAGREVRSGAMMALMALKPQLGVMLAIAAVAARTPRTVVAAALGTVLFAGLATLVSGLDYWGAFVAAIGQHDSGIRSGADYQGAVAAYGYLDLFITPYAYARGLGLADEAALGLHAALALTGAGIAALGWHALASTRHGGRAPEGLVPAVIALSLIMIPLIPHRALFYEAAFLVAAVPFLWRA